VLPLDRFEIKNGELLFEDFRFKREGSAVLGILWTRQNGHWRIVAWEAFEQ